MVAYRLEREQTRFIACLPEYMAGMSAIPVDGVAESPAALITAGKSTAITFQRTGLFTVVGLTAHAPIQAFLESAISLPTRMVFAGCPVFFPDDTNMRAHLWLCITQLILAHVCLHFGSLLGLRPLGQVALE